MHSKINLIIQNFYTILYPQIKTMEREFTIKGVVFTDSTSYSQGDKNHIPTMFSAKIGNNTITITNGHIYHKGQWLFHCYELGFNTVVLAKAKTKEEAATGAINTCKAKIEILYKLFKNL